MAHQRVVGHKHMAAGMLCFKLGPTHQPGGDQLKLDAGEFADQRSATELLPPALCLAVIHNEIGETEFAGGAEVQHPTIHGAIEDNGGVAKRAISHRHRYATDQIIGDFMPHHDPERIGAGIAIDDEADHRLAVGKIGFQAHRDEHRIIDGRNSVRSQDIANLGEVDTRSGEVGTPTLRQPPINLGAGRLSDDRQYTGDDEQTDRSGHQPLFDWQHARVAPEVGFGGDNLVKLRLCAANNELVDP